MINEPGALRSMHKLIVGESESEEAHSSKPMLIQDVQSGMGLCVIDPHGDLVYDLIPNLKKRKDQTVVLDLADMKHMLAYSLSERPQGVLATEQVAILIHESQYFR